MASPETRCAIVVTPDEHDLIRIAAALNRKSMSAYSRDLVLKAARRAVEQSGLKQKRERPQLGD